MSERLVGITQILIKVGKEAGVIPYTQMEIETMREAKSVVVEREMAARERFRHMLDAHLDVWCTSEWAYLMGLIDKDDHPEHKIVITACEHPEYQDKYGVNKTNLGWTPPNFRPEKLAA